MKKILLTGFFGHENLGDDLLLYEALKKYPKKVNLYVKWPQDAKEELQFFQAIRDFTPVVGVKDVLHNRYDAVVWSGGGLFPSRTFGFKQLIQMLPYRILAKRMILNGVGVVPKPNRRYFDRFLRIIDYCSVRDDKSLDFVSKAIPAMNCGDLYWGADVVRGGGIRGDSKEVFSLFG